MLARVHGWLQPVGGLLGGFSSKGGMVWVNDGVWPAGRVLCRKSMLLASGPRSPCARLSSARRCTATTRWHGLLLPKAVKLSSGSMPLTGALACMPLRAVQRLAPPRLSTTESAAVHVVAKFAASPRMGCMEPNAQSMTTALHPATLCACSHGLLHMCSCSLLQTRR